MKTLRLGVMFATQGAFGAPGRDARCGAELAAEHLRAEGQLPFELDLVCLEPEHTPDGYIAGMRGLLNGGCRHVFGTVTSQARKDVIPIVEKHEAQLWYVCPYEGFEANENVIYAGACPNQHLLPLMDFLLPRYGKRVFLAGANYIWGWEMNRLAREIVLGAGGEIVGERCLPIEDTDIDRLVSEIIRQRPSFILNNLIGPASYAFLRAMHNVAQGDEYFSAQHCPIVSCDLTECELPEIGMGIADGHLAAASYFDSLATPENIIFKQRAASSVPRSSFFATTYTLVRLCAEAAAKVGGDDPAQLRKALFGCRHETVLGQLHFDEKNNHAGLPFHLGRIEGQGFAIIKSLPTSAADPYLTNLTAKSPARSRPALRIVS